MTELTDLQRKGVRNAGISLLIYIVVIRLLFQSKIFNSMGVWPPKAKEQ